jgi:PKD repeat protein
VVDPTGGVRATWLWDTGSDWQVQSAHLEPSGDWTNPAAVGGGALQQRLPAVDVDPAGDCVFVWVTGTASPEFVDARALDVAGPVVTTLNAPAAATAGIPASYAVNATDTWSSVATYAWNFGDGTTASGATVTHTYVGPGSPTVTLTVTDTVGNATTKTFSTVVLPEPQTPVVLPVPAITVFKLRNQKIATDEKTKLKVKLNTQAKLKLVLKSKHRHVVNGNPRFIKVVIRKNLPQGTSRVTIKGKPLVPDTYAVIGTAKNTAGTSTKKKTKLVVVRPDPSLQAGATSARAVRELDGAPYGDHLLHALLALDTAVEQTSGLRP